MSNSIVVLGSSNTDMVVKTDRLPAPGETVTGGDFVLAPGGKGANQAVAAARLGGSVEFVARVGMDAFGDQAIEGYRREGIGVGHVSRDPNRHTGVALILVEATGENLISVASGANHALSAQDVDAAEVLIRNASVLMLQLESPIEAVVRAAAIARNAKVRVILDPAPAPVSPLPEALLRDVSVLTPNEHEAAALTGFKVTDEASARHAAEALLDCGVKTVVITLGAKGSLIAEAHGMTFVPADPVDAVDTTAAGDAFNGGLAVSLSRGVPIVEAVRTASSVGALAVTRLGAQPSLPTDAQVRDFLNR